MKKEHKMLNWVCERCGAIEEDLGFEDGCKGFVWKMVKEGEGKGINYYADKIEKLYGKD